MHSLGLRKFDGFESAGPSLLLTIRYLAVTLKNVGRGCRPTVLRLGYSIANRIVKWITQ
jgi:hypothetical protein